MTCFILLVFYAANIMNYVAAVKDYVTSYDETGVFFLRSGVI